MTSTKDMPIKALAPWFGGKRNLAPTIVAELGEHRVYWEPFCGGMPILLLKEPCVMETVNDLHAGLINLAQIIQHATLGPMLYRQLRRVLMHESLFDAASDKAREDERSSLIQKMANAGFGESDSQRLLCAYDYFITSWMGRNGCAGQPQGKTGSCPCQPFSNAGKMLGEKDERHLWPAFLSLIAERRPAEVFGEQVASKAGRGWLGGVFADLEALGYACCGADMCAAGVGAPHIRQRLFWHGRLADAECSERRTLAERRNGEQHGPECERETAGGPGPDCETDRLADTENADGRGRECGLIGFKDGKTRRIGPGISPLAHGIPARVVRLRGYGNAIVPQLAAEFIIAAEEAMRQAAAKPRRQRHRSVYRNRPRPANPARRGGSGPESVMTDKKIVH